MDHEDLPQEADMRDKVLEILTKLCKFVLRPPFNTESRLFTPLDLRVRCGYGQDFSI
ncbi:hypothetical protein BGW38_004566, partial [Lunasporangiospora selenospora]